MKPDASKLMPKRGDQNAEFLLLLMITEGRQTRVVEAARMRLDCLADVLRPVEVVWAGCRLLGRMSSAVAEAM